MTYKEAKEQLDKNTHWLEKPFLNNDGTNLPGFYIKQMFIAPYPQWSNIHKELSHNKNNNEAALITEGILNSTELEVILLGDLNTLPPMFTTLS